MPMLVVALSTAGLARRGFVRSRSCGTWPACTCWRNTDCALRHWRSCFQNLPARPASVARRHNVRYQNSTRSRKCSSTSIPTSLLGMQIYRMSVQFGYSTWEKHLDHPIDDVSTPLKVRLVEECGLVVCWHLSDSLSLDDQLMICFADGCTARMFIARAPMIV